MIISQMEEVLVVVAGGFGGGRSGGFGGRLWRWDALVAVVPVVLGRRFYETYLSISEFESSCGRSGYLKHSAANCDFCFSTRRLPHACFNLFKEIGR